ncbi:fungal-specific transcription factor domain-containing protein [Suillus subalutaceus]|uniref:fungal-specific transcription factor domain-containing protein n=1 Tax=Suillus subalutaceus TaxID=48586 RepID=UPI001B867111|nr:fungal-specific transcription factor domain-containing protein [Suillus subalutaceus]KAG1843956.1 fungal-specific transcription factor domain-containing protein [Suillus subalutaceus]
MTHILPPHTDLNLVPSSLHSALHMDPNQQQQQLQQPNQPHQQQAPTTSKKRGRKADTNSDDAGSPSEPRRLRRSHEACARCRSKKIKCDSKHPKCTACATAGVPCQQEDRHRQTLTLRGHTEFIERQIAQCDALLKRHISDFSMANLDEICRREGIEVDGHPAPEFAQSSPQFPQQPNGPPPGAIYGPPFVHPAYPYGVPMPHGYPSHMPMPGPPGAYGPIHPGFPPPPPQHMQAPPQVQPQPQPQPQQPQQPHPVPPPVIAATANVEVKGQDPQSLDMSTTRALAKSFGVHPLIVNDSHLGSGDKEDLAVGSNGLSSGRDRGITEQSIPRDLTKWISISVATSNTGGSSTISTSALTMLWMPKDRSLANRIVDVYFNHLNVHRPVFFRSDFEHKLNALYDGENVQHDPGFICSMYLILALGTLSELNHQGSIIDKDKKTPSDSPINTKKLLPAIWPEHDEFFERALAVKPHLRVTISSLQALLLLHWYLYTERQGRSLWRLVGSLVRLSIELGLHHDPTAQPNTFTDEECQLRIRLWGTVMVHDRGTSILLGRPLAIAPYDSNTPRPTHGLKGQNADFSEHFLLSHPIAEIQADIINSLYAPSRQSADTIMRHATRIIKSMLEFRRQLPDSYKWYFGGTEDWPLERRQKLVQGITEDQGLTLLKFGIARILLLRALFSLKELDYNHRSKALVDAIVTSHNIIIVHNQLIRFPDIAFFVSPDPLHIAAMVILYGHMSHCERLSRQVMIEDVWMALDMLPRFRWRWERKDLNGGHPLISKLAEKVLNVNLRTVGPTKDPVLLSELDWEADSPGMLSSPALSGQQQLRVHPGTPTMSHPSYSMADKLAEVPAGLFYPFYQNPMSATPRDAGVTGGDSGQDPQGYGHLLAAAAQPNGTYGCQPSSDSYMLEEIVPTHGNQVWMNVSQRSMSFAHQA